MCAKCLTGHLSLREAFSLGMVPSDNNDKVVDPSPMNSPSALLPVCLSKRGNDEDDVKT
jgi:hypothetical protein